MINPFTGIPTIDKALTEDDKDLLLDDDKWLFDLASKLNIPGAAGGAAPFNLAAHTTDELPEGTTNLYSQWEVIDTGTYDYLQPTNDAYGLIIGAEGGISELVASFAGASAFFIDNTGQGLNYYVISGIGTSFVSLGGTVMSTNARGTPGSEAQIPSGGILGTHAFAAYDGNNYSINFGSGAYGVLPGLYAVLASDPTADAFDLNVGIQALLGKSYVTAKMRNSSQNLVVINDANDDIDFQVNWDTGTALLVEGSSGQSQFAVGSAATPSISFAGDPDTGIHWVAANQISFDTSGLARMQISSTTTVVNPGKIATGDFQVHGDTVDNLIFTDASADAIGFFNATPVAQSTGWSVTNETTDKSFDANATSIDELADVLGTLIETLKTYGILGA